MSEFIKMLRNKVENEGFSFFEISQINDILGEYGYSLKKVCNGKSALPLGQKSKKPVNPVSGHPIDSKKMDDFIKKTGVCGQFATKNQWLKVGRKPFDAPIVVKIYNSEIEYFPYESTDPVQ